MRNKTRVIVIISITVCVCVGLLEWLKYRLDYLYEQEIKYVKQKAYKGDRFAINLLYSHAAVDDPVEHSRWMQKITKVNLEIGRYFVQRGNKPEACFYLLKAAEQHDLQALDLIQTEKLKCEDAP